MSIRALSARAHHPRATMGKAARNRHNEARRGAQKRSAHNVQAAKLNKKTLLKRRAAGQREGAQPSPKQHDETGKREREHRVSVMAWACHGGVSEETLALGHEQERFWREQMQTDKAETRQRQVRDNAETRQRQDIHKTDTRQTQG
jgi:hypothetical protein